MKLQRVGLLVAAGVLLGAVGLQAQLATLPARHSVAGRSVFEVAVTGKPYSLVETTTTEQTLGDGTKITHVGEMHKMRDSEGRTRIEAYWRVDGANRLLYVALTDPLARTKTLLIERTRTAQVTQFPEPTPEEVARAEERSERLAKARAAQAEREKSGAVVVHHLAAGSAGSAVEKLPASIVGGVMADGFRTTGTIAKGKEGNDRDMKFTMETWTATDLGIVVGQTSDDPRYGTRRVVVSELQQMEPDPALFRIPEGWTVKDGPSLEQ